jgi:hypothetical protein
MDTPTRQRALQSLLPDFYRHLKYIDYSSLEVKRGDLFGNAIARRLEWKPLLSRFQSL